LNEEVEEEEEKEEEMIAVVCCFNLPIKMKFILTIRYFFEFQIKNGSFPST